MNKKRILPPSKAGNGIKFIIPTLTLNKAIRLKTLYQPASLVLSTADNQFF